ncbi:MAG: formylglycine-generating enzyme family protein, partial [Verrucomicrobia bacterium]|nr:formylglycine-generating enzyme family protein [Verrucomicrobiota bacterium]
MKTPPHDPLPSEKRARSDAGVDLRVLFVWSVMSAIMVFGENVLQKASGPGLSTVHGPLSTSNQTPVSSGTSSNHSPSTIHATAPLSLPSDLVPVPDTATDPATGLPVWVRSRVTQILFRLISPGSFKMGSAAGALADDDEQPRHTVHLSPYFISVSPIANALYEQFAPEHRQKRGAYCKQDAHPAARVTYAQAMAFGRWLSQQEGVATNAYTLPTEAQFERATRGAYPNASYLYPNGDDELEPGYDAYSASSALAVDAGPTNSFGLYDLVAGVYQWTRDWYAQAYNDCPCAARDPSGPDTGKLRALRGGTWSIYAMSHRAADRFKSSPDTEDDHIGLRVVRTLDT